MKQNWYLLLLGIGASASQVHTMAEGARHKYTSGVGVPWGPQNCAELLRSDSGTCVIRTACSDVDLSKFEFAFDCESSGEIQRHSFGVGGFDDDDDFDTNVKCTTCLPPNSKFEEEQVRSLHHSHHEIAVENISSAAVPAAVIHNHIHQEVAVSKVSSIGSFRASASKSPHTHHEVVVVGVKLSSAGQADVKEEEKEKEEKKEEEKKEEPKEEPKEEKKEEPKEETKEEHPASPADVAQYGPENCVSTWRDTKTGTCIMQTSCSDQDTVNHMFGLICKQGEGNSSLVRHLFGTDSFAAKETFDTLISCQECLSMGYVKEDAKADKDLVAAVKDLAGVVKEVKDGMKGLKSDVAALNSQVFPEDEKNSKAKEDAKKEEAADKDAEEDAKDNKTALFDTGINKHITVRSPEQLRGGDGHSGKPQSHKESVGDADSDDNDDDSF